MPQTPSGRQIYQRWLELQRAYSGYWDVVSSDLGEESLALWSELQGVPFKAELRPMDVNMPEVCPPAIHGAAKQRSSNEAVTSHLTGEPCLAAHLVFRGEHGIYLRSVRATPLLVVESSGAVNLLRGALHVDITVSPTHRRPQSATAETLLSLGMGCDYQVPGDAEEFLVREGDQVRFSLSSGCEWEREHDGDGPAVGCVRTFDGDRNAWDGGKLGVRITTVPTG